jgi:NDP-sugar pyrophosphorylase family protein
MKAMLLVGGAGTRLGSLTKWLPKPLLPVANVRLLTHTLKALSQAGVTVVHTNPCYLAERFIEETRECIEESGTSIHVTHFPEKLALGTAGGIKQAMRDEKEPFLVAFGDNWYNCNLQSLVLNHITSDALLTLGLFKAPFINQASWVKLDDEGWVDEFIEKPAVVEDEDPLSFAGVMMMDPLLLESIPDHMPLDLGFSMMPYWLNYPYKVKGYRLEGEVIDIGTPVGYLSANIAALNGIQIDPTAQVDPGVKLVAPVAIGKNSVIRCRASVGPHVAVGSDCVVAGRVEQSVILDECLIQSGEGLLRVIKTPYECIRIH